MNMNRMNCRTILALMAALAFTAVPCVAAEAPYPVKPLRIIVPWPPGGGNDLLGRTVAEKLKDQLGQPVMVENKPGASGNIGAEQAARSAPDGYTILLALNSVTINPSLYKAIPFDIQKDLVPLGIVGMMPMVLIVHPSVPATKVTELVAYVKANPGKVNYGSAGIGSPQHLAMAMLLNSTGTHMLHVPYKGASPIMPAIVSNDVQVAFNGISPTLPFLKNSRVRAVATSGANRTLALQDVPTIAEAVPGYDCSQWYGFMVPSGVPEPIRANLAEAIRSAVMLPDVRGRLEGVGFEIRPQSALQMRELIRADLVKWAKVVKDAGIQPE